MISPFKKWKLRGEDTTGNGWYGAKRGRRLHKGVDYLNLETSSAGCDVLACISGIVRIGLVYPDPNKSQFTLVEISNSVYKSKTDVCKLRSLRWQLHRSGGKNWNFTRHWRLLQGRDAEPLPRWRMEKRTSYRS